MNKTVINIADTFIDIIVASKQKPQFGQVELLADSYNIELGRFSPPNSQN